MKEIIKICVKRIGKESIRNHRERTDNTEKEADLSNDHMEFLE